jgi:hypothetical protein
VEVKAFDVEGGKAPDNLEIVPELFRQWPCLFRLFSATAFEKQSWISSRDMEGRNHDQTGLDFEIRLSA